MGLRDWFTSKPPQSVIKADSTSSSEALADDKEAFAKVRAAKATEALSLFDEDDPLPIADSPVMAPYDASGLILTSYLPKGVKVSRTPMNLKSMTLGNSKTHTFQPS